MSKPTSHLLLLLRDMLAHKATANARLLDDIRRTPAATAAPDIQDLLHHTLLANRFWLLTIQGLPFVLEDEARAAESFEGLAQRVCANDAQESAWMERASEGEMARTLEHPSIPGGRCTVAQAIVQICLHSHGHRAQLAKLLRRHGGVPSPSDFILWLAERPPAE